MCSENLHFCINFGAMHQVIVPFLYHCVQYDNLWFHVIQVSFFNQFLRSVSKVDYLTMRHGFISVSFSHEKFLMFKICTLLIIWGL